MSSVFVRKVAASIPLTLLLCLTASFMAREMRAVLKNVKSLALSDGIRLAYQEWGVNNPKKLVALHGWLDNSNSYYYLGPYLASHGYHVLAVDHIGHGLSDHLGAGASYNILKSTACIADFVRQLQWQKFDLMGHSMGASISLIYAATMHETLNKLVLLEGFGPVTEAAEDTAHNLRKALDSEFSLKQKGAAPKKYKTLTDAVDARILAVSFYPGKQSLSREAAKVLLGRGVRRVGEEREGEEKEYSDLLDETSGPVSFRHDRRLVLPSYLYHCDEQVMSYVRNVSAKTLLVTGKTGWPVPIDYMEARKKVMRNKNLLKHIELEGSHHLHMDPEHRERIASTVLHFLGASTEKMIER